MINTREGLAFDKVIGNDKVSFASREMVAPRLVQIKHGDLKGYFWQNCFRVFIWIEKTGFVGSDSVHGRVNICFAWTVAGVNDIWGSWPYVGLDTN